MKNFKQLLVWQKAIALVKEVYVIAKNIPSDERFALTSQIQRAAVSIPSNIAEGSSRSSDKDYKRFLEIALGSAYELETQLIIISELEMLDTTSLEAVNNLLIEVQRMLSNFIKKLATQSL